MGIGYVRAKKVLKKRCNKCDTIWDDDQIVEDRTLVLHGYGGDSCPFCHADWELTTIITIPKLILKANRDN
jgi:hypothetical protein